MARLDDGFSSLISFANGLTGGVKFWEKEVTPVGMAAGGAIDTSTMHNTRYRTKKPKALVTATDASSVVAYDPAFYTEVIASLGVNQLITVHFPDGHTLAFWGWLDEFKPNRLVEGEQPTAEIVIIASNQNASDVETAPVYA